MKLKLTLLSLAVTSAFSGSVLAQTSTSKTETQALTQFNRTGVITAWGRGFTGQGVKVAVLDSGFDLTHTDLRGQVVLAKNFNQASLNQIALNTNNIRSQLQGGYDIVWGLHGTQMASVVAGRLDNNAAVGVAPGAQLLLAQIGEGIRFNTTTKTWTYNDAGLSSTGVHAALRWAEANGATVANMSFGSTYDKTFQSKVTLLKPGLYQAPANYGPMYGNRATDLMNFVNASKSMVLVAAAGNQGLAYAQFPGAFATQVDKDGNLLLGGRVLIVGSVNSSNIISSFSNRAGSFCTNLSGTTCNDKYYVKDFFVVAPGEAITSSIANQIKPGNQSNPVTGTSPAAAYVSGGVAVIKQAWPQLSAAQIVHLVKTTATDLTVDPVTKTHNASLVGVDHIYGYGLVNFDKATQPYANVRYTTAALSSNSPTAGTDITTTGVTVSVPGLGGSSVLKNVQVVDGLNRNYTADLTRTIGSASPANSLYTSPYLAMQSQGYQEISAPVGRDGVLTFMRSNSGVANQFETGYGLGRISFQVGTMQEREGFLNNYGSGLLATGSSSTTYAMVGGSRPVTETIDIVGSYGFGVTNTSRADGSLLAVSPQLVSDTWRIGFAKNNIFFDGKTKDKFTVAFHGPVSIRRGHVDVTAVTGYTYTGDEDNITANPVTSTERINLASGRRQQDLILGYSVSINNTSYAGVNFVKQYNVGGVAGQTGSAVGIAVRSVF